MNRVDHFYWNWSEVYAPQLLDGSLATEWQSPTPVQQDDELMIIFSSPINVGTISFVPGSTEKVEFYIATGNTGYYNHNQPAPSFHPYYEVNHGSSIVINYSISFITIKMKEATGEPFSLREIMVFEELHFG